MRIKLTQVSTKEMGDIHTLSEEDIKYTFKPETRCGYCGDKDPWYIVDVVFDNVKKSNTALIVYKSWNKYKRCWCYRTTDIFSFLWAQALLEYLYKDENDKLIIKYKKR